MHDIKRVNTYIYRYLDIDLYQQAGQVNVPGSYASFAILFASLFMKVIVGKLAMAFVTKVCLPIYDTFRLPN
jgi:hypothetical protein